MQYLFRTGRSVGRTVYAQEGDEPAKGDRLIGLFDTPELAEFAVSAMNDAVTRDMALGAGYTLARRAYQAYGEAVGWRNYRGDPMPAFDDLGDPIQGAWRAAASAVGYRSEEGS